MSEFLRLVVLIGLGAVAMTVVVVAASWFMAEPRRLARAFRRVLGQAPDSVLIAHGRGRAAAFSFATGKIAVAWSSGAWCLVYGLEELLGADLSLDGTVAARILRGEPRRALDRTSGTEGEVTLRLLFDDPQHPDFDLLLWPTPSVRAGAPVKSAAAIGEANRWLARIEAVLKRTGAAVAKPAPPLGASLAPVSPPTRTPRQPVAEPDLFSRHAEDEDDEDDDGQDDLPF